MTIAINLTNLVNGCNKEKIFSQFESLAANRASDQFIFIVTRKQFIATAGNNSTVIQSGPPANTSLLRKIWYDFTLPSLVRKFNAAIVVHTDGLCSMRISVPQYLFVDNGLSFLKRENNKQKIPSQKLIKASLTKATAIITATQSLLEEISEQYKIEKDKFTPVPLIISTYYKPLNWDEKEQVKEKYAGGKEYFLFIGEISAQSNLVNFLKAFSFFKKRQKSNMQLVIISPQVNTKNDFIESLKTYKYRDEVKLLQGIPEHETAQILAAAYAFVYPVLFDQFSLFPLQALQCETPSILADLPAFHEIAGESAVYIQPGNVDDIAQNMMLLFKNEKERNELIKTGKAIMSRYRQTNPADLLWKAISPR